MTEDGGRYRYAAFISYRHAGPDRDAAMRLQKQLESYTLPRGLAAELGVSRRVGACFRDDTGLAASADLTAAIDLALRESRALIVVCSKRTPESPWVNEEVVRFRELGREDRILACLIEGEPASSYPTSLYELRADDPAEEVGSPHSHVPGAVDLRPKWGESPSKALKKATQRLVAGIYGCRLGELVDRLKKRRRIRWIAAGVALLALLILIAGIATSVSEELGEAEERVTVERATGVARKLATAAEEALRANEHEKAAWLAHQSYQHAERGGGKSLADADRALRAVLATPVLGSRILASKEACWRAEFSPDGRQVAVGGGGKKELPDYRGEGFVLLVDLERPDAEPTRLPHCVRAPIWIGYGPQGRWLGVSDYSGMIRIWDRKKLDAPPREFPDAYKFSEASFSPDGRLLAYPFKDGRVRICDLLDSQSEPWFLVGAMAESPHAERGFGAPIEELHSPWMVLIGRDGRQLAGVARSAAVYLWDVSRPNSPPIEFKHDAAQATYFETVALSDDGKRLVAIGDSDGKIRTWTIDSQRRLESVIKFADEGETGRLGQCFLKADGTQLMVADVLNSRTISWDLRVHPPRRRMLSLAGHTPITASYHCEEGVLATAGMDGVVVWSVERGDSGRGRLRLELTDLGLDAEPAAGFNADMYAKIGYTPAIATLAHDAARQRLVAGTPFSLVGSMRPFKLIQLPAVKLLDEISILPMPGGSEEAQSRTLPEGAGAVAVDPRSRMLIMGGTAGSVVWWDLRSPGSTGRTLLHLGDAVTRVLFCGTEGPVAIATAGGKVVLCDVFSPEGGMEELEYEGRLRDLAWHPEGNLLAACGDSGRVRIWRLDEAEIVRDWPIPGGRVNCLAFSPDGSMIATGGHEGEVHLWTPDGELIRTPDADCGCVRAVAFGQGGRVLAIGTGGRSDPLTMKDMTGGDPGKLIGGRISADDETRGFVRLYDLRPERRRNPPVVLGGDLGGVLTLAFLDEEGTLAVGTYLGECAVFSTSTARLAEEVGRLPKLAVSGAEYRSIVGEEAP